MSPRILRVPGAHRPAAAPGARRSLPALAIVTAFLAAIPPLGATPSAPPAAQPVADLAALPAETRPLGHREITERPSGTLPLPGTAQTGALPPPTRAMLAEAALDPEAAIVHARAASARRDWGEALQRWQALETVFAEDMDILIESARVHGFADRNADAAQRYRRVTATAPRLRASVLMPLAWQTLWSGDASGAHALFLELAGAGASSAGAADPTRRYEALSGLAETRIALDDNAGALAAIEQALAMRPDDRAMLQRRARLLGWLDRYDESIAAWAELGDSDVGDFDSRYGLAQARNFSGMHRAAVAEYRSAFGGARRAGIEIPQSAQFDRARALRWAGFDDYAHEALAPLDTPDAVWLRTWRTAREMRPWVSGTLEYAHDKDDLDIRAATLEGGWLLAPDTSASLGLRRSSIDDPNGSFDHEQLRFGLRKRFGSPIQDIGGPDDHGPLWASLNLGVGKYGDWNPLVGNARLRWLPTDRIALDGEIGREVIETPTALSNRVTVDVISLGIDWRARPHTLLSAAIAGLKFDDGNQRTRLNLRAEQIVLPRPRVALGIEAMAFRASDPEGPTMPGRGYWNPEQYAEARAYVALSHDVHPWDYELKLGVGTSRETDGWGTRSTGTPNLIELAVGYDITPSLRARAWIGGSGGSMAIGSGGEGYWRRSAGISITGWF